MLVVIRLVAQHVAESIEAITGSPGFGPDLRSVGETSKLLVDALVKHRRGADPRGRAR